MWVRISPLGEDWGEDLRRDLKMICSNFIKKVYGSELCKFF
jgi:hypothetical protein